jgi:hypothetical protein
MSIYPGQLDTDLQLPPATNGTTAVTAASINNLRDAILSIEQAIGVDPQGNLSDLATRINRAIDSNGNIRSSALSNIDYVPYTGALSGVNLGANGLTANNLTDSALTSGYLTMAGANGILQNTQWTQTTLNNALDGYATTTWVDGYVASYSTTAQMGIALDGEDGLDSFVQGQTGLTGATGATGSTGATGATGTVAQMVINTSTTTASLDTTSLTEVSSDYRISITPKFSGSKFLVEYCFPINPSQVPNTITHYQLIRNIGGAEVLVGVGPVNGNRHQVTYISRPNNGVNDSEDVGMIYLLGVDTGLTVGVAYTFGFKYRREIAGSGTTYFNYSNSNSSDWSWSGIMTMKITEIVQ